jgi:branched-chain amino acid transport system ATP-binding protein
MLILEGIKAAYGRIPILHGIDLRVSAGEVVGILGHNGMGKTTLLKTVIGIVPTTVGRIVFSGNDVTREIPSGRSRLGMGYVPQGREIFPKLSVMENLKLGIIMHVTSKGREQAIIEEILTEFPRLKLLLARQGGVLSGGEQQMLAIARCLGGNPKLILLDEPTEGVQPSIVEEIVEILQDLRARRNLTIVLVEQKLGFIAALAQRIHVIQRGRFIATLRVDQLDDEKIMKEFIGMSH